MHECNIFCKFRSCFGLNILFFKILFIVRYQSPPLSLSHSISHSLIVWPVVFIHHNKSIHLYQFLILSTSDPKKFSLKSMHKNFLKSFLKFFSSSAFHRFKQKRLSHYNLYKCGYHSLQIFPTKHLEMLLSYKDSP